MKQNSILKYLAVSFMTAGLCSCVDLTPEPLSFFASESDIKKRKS